jgi:hypothetical protein
VMTFFLQPGAVRWEKKIITLLVENWLTGRTCTLLAIYTKHKFCVARRRAATIGIFLIDVTWCRATGFYVIVCININSWRQKNFNILASCLRRFKSKEAFYNWKLTPSVMHH